MVICDAGEAQEKRPQLVVKAGLTGPSHQTDLAVVSIRPWEELHGENVLREETSFTANVDCLTLLCSGRAKEVYRR